MNKHPYDPPASNGTKRTSTAANRFLGLALIAVALVVSVLLLAYAFKSDPQVNDRESGARTAALIMQIFPLGIAITGIKRLANNSRKSPSKPEHHEPDKK